MSSAYGIEICRKTLIYLSSEKDIDERLNNAFSEMKVMTDEDFSKKSLEERDELTKEFYSLKKKDDIKKLTEIAEKLVWLCVDIIESNSKKN